MRINSVSQHKSPHVGVKNNRSNAIPFEINSKPLSTEKQANGTAGKNETGINDVYGIMNSESLKARKEAGLLDFYHEKSKELYEGLDADSLSDTSAFALDRTIDLLFGCEGIDTSKRLNANSTGDHVLTDEEISYLQKKYDIDNITVEKGFISSQKGYDLLQELTEMNVLTTSDVIGMKLTPLPRIGGRAVIVEGSPTEARFDFGTGEYIAGWRAKYANDPVEYLLRTAEWLAGIYEASLERGGEPDDRIQVNVDAKMKIAGVFKMLGMGNPDNAQ